MTNNLDRVNDLSDSYWPYLVRVLRAPKGYVNFRCVRKHTGKVNLMRAFRMCCRSTQKYYIPF